MEDQQWRAHFSNTVNTSN